MEQLVSVRSMVQEFETYQEIPVLDSLLRANMDGSYLLIDSKALHWGSMQFRRVNFRCFLSFDLN